MFKKLQNLLFEDDESVEEEEIDEEETVAPKIVKQATPKAKEPAPVSNNQKTAAMQRIDVTRPMAAIDPVKKAAPVQQQAKKDSVFKTTSVPSLDDSVDIAPTTKKPSLGITVDDIPTQRKVSTVNTANRARVQTQNPSQVNKQETKISTKKYNRPKPPVYEFQPIISPFFGVDEKDLNAVQTTGTNKYDPYEKTTVSQIISPMYGVSKDEQQVAPVQPSTIRTKRVDDGMIGTDKSDDDTGIPEFSLDEILKVRDQEKNDVSSSDVKTLFDDDDLDTTTVLEKKSSEKQ